ncbi:hypothetical protein EYF80_048611 [Liparis tanakae]|uniref:Uncharacterized protein n=1 Tax=Liparis tanakae TaxID=230148 RepID=A0A4Z2FJA9_9TELE|nr:hypothetical protein EYF80_048611 [Liparis tanakae]
MEARSSSRTWPFSSSSYICTTTHTSVSQSEGLHGPQRPVDGGQRDDVQPDVDLPVSALRDDKNYPIHPVPVNPVHPVPVPPVPPAPVHSPQATHQLVEVQQAAAVQDAQRPPREADLTVIEGQVHQGELQSPMGGYLRPLPSGPGSPLDLLHGSPPGVLIRPEHEDGPDTGMLRLSSLVRMEHIVMVIGMASK